METWALPLLKTIAPLGVMAVSGRIGSPLPLSIAAGAASVALLFGMGFKDFFGCALAAVSSPDSVILTLTVAAIVVFNHLLEITGRLAGLLPALEARVSNRGLRLAFFPMLVGLLPMPGGAVFSAPMVDSVSRGMGLKGVDKAVVNYWFRHTCEYAWPLYPGIFMAGSLAGLPLYRLCLAFIPVTLLSFVVGMASLRMAGIGVFASEEHRETAARVDFQGAAAGTGLMEGLGPILLILVLFPLLEGPVRGLLGSWGARNAGLPAALIVGIAVLCCLQRGLFAKACRFAFSTRVFSLSIGVVSIMFFKETIENNGAAAQMATGFGNSGAGVLVLAVMIPFVTGLVMGYSPGMVGASFPMLLKTFATMGPTGSARFVIIAFCAGFAGVLLSPAHLCLILTKEYFGVDTKAFYTRLVPMTLALMAGVFIYALAAPLGWAFR